MTFELFPSYICLLLLISSFPSSIISSPSITISSNYSYSSLSFLVFPSFIPLNNIPLLPIPYLLLSLLCSAPLPTLFSPLTHSLPYPQCLPLPPHFPLLILYPVTWLRGSALTNRPLFVVDVADS